MQFLSGERTVVTHGTLITERSEETGRLRVQKLPPYAGSHLPFTHTTNLSVKIKTNQATDRAYFSIVTRIITRRTGLKWFKM